MSRRRIEPFWLAMNWQPIEGSKVEFRVRPFPLHVATEVRLGLQKRKPSGESVTTVLRECVIGWRGVVADGEPVEFSQEALDDMAEMPTSDESLWALEITLELTKRFLIGDTERKNSGSPVT